MEFDPKYNGKRWARGKIGGYQIGVGIRIVMTEISILHGITRSHMVIQGTQGWGALGLKNNREFVNQTQNILRVLNFHPRHG